MAFLHRGKKWLGAGMLALSLWGWLAAPVSADPSEPTAGVSMQQARQLENVTLTWDIVPEAVQYELVVFSGHRYRAENVVLRQRDIYCNGVALAKVPMGKEGLEQYRWFVQALDLEGKPLGKPARPQPLPTGIIALQAPLPLGEMEKMDYVPLYPVYAWVPYPGAAGYQVEVLQEQDEESRHLAYCYTAKKEYYDDDPLNEPGLYCWRVRALDAQGEPMSAWSEEHCLRVVAPTPVAALGDSITHGGGAANTPPCFSLYSWETYAGLPVKNLGRSGDTTAAMVERFAKDVLPFAPKVLVVMGGVNDFREGTSAKESIRNLKEIKRKCRAHGIIPVFATATPVNPQKMAKLDYIEDAAPNWLEEQQKLNAWIMRQRYAVDAAASLTAADGTLRGDLTTDGLHPDSKGKRLLGEAIGAYLRENGLDKGKI